ncbi:MAG: rod shape-determining protein MreC [Alistipes senegalensis]|nr:rod shape-determining protein MreC [Bacteroides cellulosilyticus]MCM1351211.1 rod shape-determining protein MreC [Alistipes senegalensis]
MYKLIEFIRSIYVVVLFVAIEAIAIGHYARSTHYARARLLAKATQVVGAGHDALAGIRSYFRLERENRDLLEYTARLQERLSAYETAAKADLPLPTAAVPPTSDSLAPVASEIPEAIRRVLQDPQYRTLTASIVSSTINKPENFLVLNRGTRDGVKREMAVISSNGAIVGYVVHCTKGYAIALSVLSSSFRTSGMLSGSTYRGSIYWDGADPHTVLMGDLSKYADPQPGREIETNGSLFFPDGVKIGRILDAELDETGTTYTARVELDACLSGLSHVILVENRDLDEIHSLMQSDSINRYIRH